MDRSHSFLTRLAAVVVLVVGGCTTISAGAAWPGATNPAAAAETVTATPSAPPVAELTPTPEPIDTTAPTSTPTSAPTPPAAKPAPTPKPTPVLSPAEGWTAPQRLGGATDCQNVTAAIDAAGRYHVAAECHGAIHYYVSTDSGRTWTARVFTHAANRQELHPQIAIQGDVVYVASTRIVPDGGCGSLGSDVGVYVRSRKLPGGAWSAASRIGPVADSLQSFAVSEGTLAATVQGNDGLSYYETLSGSTYERHPISNAAIGPSTMLIGSDGQAHIAYAAEYGAGGIRYATFTGAGFSATRVYGTAQYDSDPVAALDGSDKAHVVWTRYEPAACGMRAVGTYYATNASGTWKTQRITKHSGETALQVDKETGRVHVLVGLEYFTMRPDGSWTHTTLAQVQWVMSVALRLDPTTGTTLVVYIDGSRPGQKISSMTTLPH